MDEKSELASLRREVVALRHRVAELQRRVQRPDDSQEFIGVSEREELLREAERITNTGSWIWDVSADEVSWSDQLFRILGYDPDVDEATTENYFARVHPDDVGYARQAAADAIATGIAKTTNYRILLPSGEIRWVSLNAAILVDEAGEPDRIVGTARDTTEERTAALALAEAHRLELLDDIDAEARATILSAVDSASSVTAQLLAFGQQAQLRPRITDLNDVATKTVSLVRPLIGDAHTLELRLSEAELPCRLDDAHLSEALSNLLLHVRDAMSEGGTIRITTARKSDNLCLIIEDNGTGYSPSDRVFEPFFQATGGHVDLRMAMAHGIVVQHGGCISAAPSDEGGNRFTLRFQPLATTVDADLPVREGGGGALTILVVDDQAPVARVVSRLLRNEGHTVFVADHPHRAIDLYAHHAGEIDVLLTDLAMPEMLGTELVAELESRWTVPHVVFMSGYATEAERAIDERYTLLHKPFTRVQLLDVLRQLSG